MTSFFNFNNIPVRFQDHGKGEPLIFLHGYLESLEIWNEFVPDLERDFRVICVDLPGHGKTGILEKVSTMELMADVVIASMDYLGIQTATVVGHSMGGYAALSMLEHYQERMGGLILFHSHTHPDSDMVKKKRKREIKIIEKGQKKLLVRQNIPNMFANNNLCAFERELKITQWIAMENEDQGVIAAILGLMERPDRSKVLESANIPSLNIIGRYDNYIDYKAVSLKTKLPKNGHQLILRHSGHMGFFEEKAESLEGIRNFLRNN